VRRRCAWDILCPPSGLLGESVACRVQVRSLVPHTLHSLRLSLRVPLPSTLPPTSPDVPRPGVKVQGGRVRGPLAGRSSLPALLRLASLPHLSAATEEGVEHP